MNAIHDLHNHLLPGVDDGSRTMTETLRHLSILHDQGVTDVVFTPHLRAERHNPFWIEAALDIHRARFEDVRRKVEGRPGYPDIQLGQEILAREPADLDRIVDRLDVGLGGGPALLVEFGFEPGFDAEGVIRRVRAEGRQIVVAHPERYDYGYTDPVVAVGRWRALGAMMQVNAGSLAGLYTCAIRDLAWRLVRVGLVDIVSSDHHGDARPHSPHLCCGLLERATNGDTVTRLMAGAPRELVAGLRLVEVAGAS